MNTNAVAKDILGIVFFINNIIKLHGIVWELQKGNQ